MKQRVLCIHQSTVTDHVFCNYNTDPMLEHGIC